MAATHQPIALTSERYIIATNALADRDINARTITGAWEAAQQTLPAGSMIIQMDQPLARLVFILFDPRSDDGFMWWNILDPILGATPGAPY